jgi:hypothetical protein
MYRQSPQVGYCRDLCPPNPQSFHRQAVSSHLIEQAPAPPRRFKTEAPQPLSSLRSWKPRSETDMDDIGRVEVMAGWMSYRSSCLSEANVPLLVRKATGAVGRQNGPVSGGHPGSFQSCWHRPAGI